MPSITFTNLTRAIEIGANCYALEIGDRRVVLDSGLHPKLDGEPALPDFRRSRTILSKPSFFRTRITTISARSRCSCVGNRALQSS